VQPVPFASGGLYREAALQKDDGSTNKGAFGRAVRLLPDREYDLIWRMGFGHILGLDRRERPPPDLPEEPLPLATGWREERSPFVFDDEQNVDREIITQLVSRPFRDRAFAAYVKSVYSDTCAFSGLKIINGGGRSEVQAAHIRPVHDHGPDSVRNGLALSGTMHWLFDRGLLSLDDDDSLLLARDRVPDTVRRMLVPDGRALLPARVDVRPHPRFLAYHRDNVFKG
jgi:putative restriction endonuclease